jgi:16S rRNA (cytosine967-C5)-methyltransferase
MPRRGTPQSSREVARHVLRRVRQDGAYANLALSAALGRARLEGPDRHLATELVYGVLRRQRLLDHALGRHAQRPLDHLDAEVLDALRVGAYQMLCLDRVPAHAAVNDAVEAVRWARGPSLAGFANAVLRRLVPGDLEQGLPEDPAARLAIAGSLPDALVRLWVVQLGLDEAQLLAQRLLRPAPLTARVNTLKIDAAGLVARLGAEGVHAAPGRLAPDALRLGGAASPFASATYLDGAWTAQDEAAQLVALLLEPPRGGRVLDGCAGVGGKATHIAALMGDVGEVTCVDSRPRKLELLREHCLRLGVQCCQTRQADLRQPGAAEEAAYDRVVVDAPCSGLGVLGRHPELKWRSELLGHQAELVVLQRALLVAAHRALRPGGLLVYSVCTTTDEEGPEQVRWLLRERSDLELAPARDGALAALASDGLYRLWPHRHDTDGFFLARFRRR